MNYNGDLARMKTQELIQEGLYSQWVRQNLDPARSQKGKNPGSPKRSLLLIAYLIAGLTLGGIVMTQVVF